jgi:hypothetical protein
MSPKETPLEKKGNVLKYGVMQGCPDTEKKHPCVTKGEKQIHHFLSSIFDGHHTLPSNREL